MTMPGRATHSGPATCALGRTVITLAAGSTGGALAGLVLIGTFGVALLCLGWATRHSTDFYEALIRHVEAQRRLQNQSPVPSHCYRRDRRALGTGLLAGGWLVLGLGLVPLFHDLLSP
jgi:hypothetical protein